MDARADPKPKTNLQRSGLIAVILSLGVFGAVGAWAQLTEIRGAVIASGSVAVVGKPKSIQHLDGGVVEEIHVSDGDMVDVGDVLIRLDATLLTANLEIYRNRLAEAQAREARLEAERLGAREVVFPERSQLIAGVDIEVRQAAQIEMFETRAAVEQGRRDQLSEKVRQYANQIDGVEALIAAKTDQLDLLDQELDSVAVLQEKGLARAPQLLGLQRTRADILGQIAEHRSELARISNSIRDTELEILKGENEFREEAVTELADVTASIAELTQQVLSTEKQLERVDILAPVAGAVHEMQIVTIGGVVAPGATVVQIIPYDQGIEFETRVDPAAIDQVFVGQPAKIVVTALNQRTTPELYGEVVGRSPNSVIDEATGAPFFRVRLTVSDDERARLGDVDLTPGMPVEAYIQTEDRTVMSYLTRPLKDQLGRAFREE